MQFFRSVFSAVIILALTCSMSFGAERFLDGIVGDLGAMEAGIIKGPAGTTLINKGSANQVKKGDLWTVYAPGEPVIDPATGARLGDFTAPLAVCRVKDPAENFSEVTVQCLKENCTLESGLKAIRFKDINTVYMDKTGSTFATYKELRRKLSHLDWQGYVDGLSSLPEKVSFPFKIVIAAGRDRLTLWSGGELLSGYPFSSNLSRRTEQHPRPSSGGLSVTPGLEAPGFATEIEIKDSRSVASLDRFAHNIGVAETPETKSPYLLYFADRSVYAEALKGGAEYQFSYRGFGEPVNMSVADNGLLALNIYVPGEGMRSKVLRITDQGFQIVAEDIEYLLSFFTNPVAGGKPELVGQAVSRKGLPRPVVYRLSLAGNSVDRKEAIDPPPGYNITGAFRTDLNGNGTPENVFFNHGGRLVIHESGRKVWESSSAFDAPLKTLLINDPNYQEAAPSELKIWSQAALFRYNEKIYAAVALNQAAWTSLIGNKSRHGTVGILTPSGNYFKLRYLADHFQGSIQDVHVYGDELLIAVGEGNSFSSQGGRTHIVALPLDTLVPARN